MIAIRPNTVSSAAAGNTRKTSAEAITLPIAGPTTNPRFAGRYAKVITRPLVASVADADSIVNDTLKSAAARPFTTVHATVNGSSSRVKNGTDHSAASSAHPTKSVWGFP